MAATHAHSHWAPIGFPGCVSRPDLHYKAPKTVCAIEARVQPANRCDHSGSIHSTRRHAPRCASNSVQTAQESRMKCPLRRIPAESRNSFYGATVAIGEIHPTGVGRPATFVQLRCIRLLRNGGDQETTIFAVESTRPRFHLARLALDAPSHQEIDDEDDKQ